MPIARPTGARSPLPRGPFTLAAVICFLFIFGLFFCKGWVKWGLLGIVVVGVVLSWGKNFSAVNYFLFDHFPYYNKFRAPAMALVMPQLAFPLLAALGLNELLITGQIAGRGLEEIPRRHRCYRRVAGRIGRLLFYGRLPGCAGWRSQGAFRTGQDATAIAGPARRRRCTGPGRCYGSALIKALQSDRQSIYGSDLMRTILLIAVAAALVGLFIRGKIKSWILLAGLAVLSTYDLVAVSARYLNSDSYTDEADFTASLNPTPADQQIRNDPDKNFRVFDESSQSPLRGRPCVQLPQLPWRLFSRQAGPVPGPYR